MRDITNGLDLYTKLPDTIPDVSTASILKLATAMVAYAHKSGVLDSESVTVTSGDLSLASSDLGLQANDVMTWRDALYCLLMGSDNGIAETIARMDAADITAAAFFNGGKRHIMLRRNGGEVAIYVNGVKGSGTQDLGATALNSGWSSLAIGARSQATPDFVTPGKYDEVRITNGAARQTADKFTPTGRAFPRSGP